MTPAPGWRAALRFHAQVVQAVARLVPSVLPLDSQEQISSATLALDQLYTVLDEVS